MCGETNNLHLHHIDENLKTFRWSSIADVAMHRIMREMENTMLLCIRCHAVAHDNFGVHHRFDCECACDNEEELF